MAQLFDKNINMNINFNNYHTIYNNEILNTTKKCTFSIPITSNYGDMLYFNRDNQNYKLKVSINKIKSINIKLYDYLDNLLENNNSDYIIILKYY